MATVELTFGYNGSDFKRTVELEANDSITAADVKSAVNAINASLAGGTDGGLGDFFLADDFDGTNGKFNKIVAAKHKVTTETVIYPATNQEGGN